MKTLRLAVMGVAFLWAVVFLASVVCAQTSSTGALTVAVTDPSGAAVPGASVTVSDSAGLTRVGTTSGQGSYTFSLLPPGNYAITISAQGFKTVNAPSVTVTVTETAVLNQPIEIGSQTQVVTVTAQAPLVQTESSTLGGVVGQAAIVSLPLITRNYTQILSLSPGVSQSVSDATVYGEGVQGISVNGNNNNQNNYQLDGSDIYNFNNGTANDPIGFFGGTAIPSPDAIQEFKVQTANWDASYGQHSGSSVDVVIKSGTNDWHGGLFEFLRNTVFNANTFFRNSLDEPRGALKQNQFGGTLGGPIRKNKLFIFLSYQGTRQVNGLAAQGLQSADLPPQLTNNRTAAALGAEFCPANNIAGSSYRNGTFAGGTQVACDGSNINPVALAILNAKLPATGFGSYGGEYFIPTPQTVLNPGTAQAVGFSTFTVPAVFNSDQIMGKLDYAISPRNTFTYTYLFARTPELISFNGCTGCSPGSGEQGQDGNQNNVARLTSTLASNVVNEALFSISYIRATVNTLMPLTATAVGMKPNMAWFPLLPDLSFSSLGYSIGDTTQDGAAAPETQYQWDDDVSWAHGRHSFRFGFTQEYLRSLNLIFGWNRGTLTFPTFQDFLLGQSAAQNGSPSGLSNILTSTANETNPPGTLNLLRANYSAVYAQDDFKVNSRLTLNLGVRWEYDGSWHNALGTAYDAWLSLLNTVPIPPSTGTFVGYTEQPGYSVAKYGPLPTGFYTRSKGVLTRNGSPLDDFAPRLGLAWQPFNTTGRFVVRAGYGWFYDRIHGNSQGLVFSTAEPLGASRTNTGTANALATLADPLNPAATLAWSALERTPTSELSPGANVDENQYPNLITTYSLDIQYKIKPSWLLQVGYVGSRGDKLQSTKYFPLPALASPTNPINCAAPFGCITTNTTGNAFMRDSVLGFAPGGIRDAADVGDSYYNSFQTLLRKSFSHGLTMETSYSFQKSIDDVALLSNVVQSVKSARGLSNFINPQRLVVNYVYSLPNYRDSQGLLGRALSGWGLSGVTTLQDGLPMTFTDANGGGAYGFVSNTRAQFCPGEGVANVMTSGSVVSRLHDYFNRSAFAQASSPTNAACPFPLAPFNTLSSGSPDLKATLYGNSGVGILRGPGQFNWDIAISKNTRVGGIREDGDVEFRAEMFNAFNHPQFSNPSTVVSSSAFGTISTTSVSPRTVQFALKYIF